MKTLRIFENIINHKINTITGSELLKYAQQFQLSISRAQADKVASILRGRNVNIFVQSERTKVLKEMEKIVGVTTTKEVERLLIKFTN